MTNVYSSEDKGSSAERSAADTSWDQGWYIYEGGQVRGPLVAKDAFQETSGVERLVSRKGFSQWYPVSDFAEIHRLATQFQPTTPTKSPQVTAHHIGPSTSPKQASPLEAYESIVKQAQQELNTKTNQPAEDAQFPISLRGLPGEGSKKFEAQTQPYTLTRRQMERPPTFESQYFEVAGRLRLGRVISPSVRALVYVPLTLGFYWWAWFSRTSEEVSWHLNGASRMNFIVPIWMCMIPGVHFILAYLVARMVHQMEEQNGYKTVNPAFATVAAVFPPFYIFMIQSALNRHWKLHVCHSLKK